MPSIFSRSRSTPTPQKNLRLDTTDEFGRVSSRSSQLPLPPPDGFLPFTLDRPRDATEIDYGYLAYERHVVLGLEQVSHLVDVVSEELGTRGGITTPFIFSSMALDLSSTSTKRLIRTFIDACVDPDTKQRRFREEARFAGPHELGMLLRWGLGRLVRIADGQEERGIISWDHYTDFRDSELAANFPPTHFSTFLPPLPAHLRSIVITVLSVLTRLTANSSSSGHTPPTLSPLFGPLFFGLGPPALPFHHTYIYYLRATNAMEHIILSFIRFQDSPRSSSASMGVPTRLKEWIKGYPIMLADQSLRPQPRKGARTSRVLSVRRNVRAYTKDLVKSASTWECNLGKIVGKAPVKYSDGYRKRMNMPSQFEAGEEDGERFRSLTDLKWGEFESLGFGGLGQEKLQFDLNESARTERNIKRQTLSWNDFSSTGFSRSDITPLSATLQFSPPMAATISSYQPAEYAKKLKKAAKHIPAFGWDTEPVVGQEEVIEEAFLDVFCDILCGWAGVTDMNEADRECNWALIEFQPDALLLFEEFVPLEYRQQIGSSSSGSSRRRLPSLFLPTSPSSRVKTKSKKDKTERSKPKELNPKTSFKEVEFEGLLKGDGNRKTKVITLGSKDMQTHTMIGSPSEVEPPPPMLQSLSHESSARSDDSSLTASTIGGTPSNRRRFRLGGSGTPTNGGSVMGRKSLIGSLPPAEYSSVDFETRLASLDGEDVYEDYPPFDGMPRKREFADDAWVDILVGTQERRMAGQEYGGRGKGRGEDVDLVSLEVEKALKGVRNLSQSPESQRTERIPVRNEEEESIEVERVPSRLAMNDYVDDPRHPQYYDDSLDYDADGPLVTEQSIQSLHYDRHEDEEDERDTVEQEQEQEEEEKEEPEPRPAPPKRPGYFDLHPERRPVAQLNGDGEDPRARFGHDSDSEDEHSGPGIRPLPRVPPIINLDEEPSPSTAPLKVPSKTAALIEIYRERERNGGASQVAPPKALPTPTPKLVTIPVPVEEEAVEESEEDVSPPPRVPVIDEDQGRASPGRYVHGAPLHNVLEEEEEE
ncbi:uncharacterized protein BT62DRAFT_1011045 [Guyanagaster necrorhizus]|uniref:Meiotically up-regulated protein Msb1/Mug8 domain-containing protein n=1 Tax=Guyanagaster necrorhizus TaxID=856835 RepID=A0A9P7VLA5_9AGAR|nr:uncharacterized protein BT62DRAFT_1011045 [Guyanagaster necrorhizus MCA 3950]KAG7442004.1 hypothetical protein BT62DRAFT_1011045 [Guyanagaster necrorhizus MCA 3950]